MKMIGVYVTMRSIDYEMEEQGMEAINRTLLKNNAKITMKRNFWMMVLVCCIGTFLGGDFTGLNASAVNYVNLITNMNSGAIEPEFYINRSSNNQNYSYSYNYKDIYDAFTKGLQNISDELFGSNTLGTVLFVILVVSVVFFAIYILTIVFRFLVGSFLGAPIAVGRNRFFMKNRLGEGKLSDLFAAFGRNRYMKIVGTMFRTNIRIFLWSLLFWIPGIIKLYEYFFVGYIMSENPNIDFKRAKELSSALTNGHKWEMFVLNLSFLGWYMVYICEVVVLCICSCGLLALPAVLLGYPLVAYQRATYAELYEERREYALMSGMATPRELIGFRG